MQNSTATTFESSSSSGNGSNDAGDFECNICFELAQDPIVTLCGHLYCWPCLYRWLRLHSQSHECPVCKALIQEEKLVPLYGRGRTSTDPRSKPVPGVEIPRRPAGQRPETAPPPESHTFPNPGFGLMGGLFPGATASFGNFTMSAGFGGLFPSLLSFQFNGFQEADSIDLEDSKVQWAAIKMSKKRTEEVSIKLSLSKRDMQTNIDDEQPIICYIPRKRRKKGQPVLEECTQQVHPPGKELSHITFHDLKEKMTVPVAQVPSFTLEPSKRNTQVG
uniref:E3 ubiquitin-protein ligase RMA n=1 Tax=Solanum tuberosum TaxID=4113 RepID=M0ZL06_SOLTU